MLSRLVDALDPDIERVVDLGKGVVIAHRFGLDQAVKVLLRTSLNRLVRFDQDREDTGVSRRGIDILFERFDVAVVRDDERIARSGENRRDVFPPLEHTRGMSGSLEECLEFGDARSRLIVGEVVMFHIRDGLVNDGKVETAALDPIARIGGPRYARLGEIVTLNTVFQTPKSKD